MEGNHKKPSARNGEAGLCFLWGKKSKIEDLSGIFIVLKRESSIREKRDGRKKV